MSLGDIHRDTSPDEAEVGSVFSGWVHLVLAIGIALQLLLAMRGQVLPLYDRMRSAWGSPVVLRSAIIGFGTEFGAFVEFVRANVPEDGIVALPPAADEPVLGHTGLMQYLFFPRQTTNCGPEWPVSQCLALLEGESVYVLRVGDFPVPQIAELLQKRYLEFSGMRGLYLPESERGD